MLKKDTHKIGTSVLTLIVRKTPPPPPPPEYKTAMCHLILTGTCANSWGKKRRFCEK